MKIKREFKGKSLWAFPNDYTVVDIEANVTELKECEIIELSAVKYRNNEVSDTFSVLVRPSEKINWFVRNLTGITDEMLENGAPIDETLDEFNAFVGDDVLLGYNVQFDVNVIYDAMMKHKNQPLTNDFVDVLRFAKKGLKDEEIPNRKQTTVAEYFGIDVEGAHRALKDCLICNAVYQKLRERLE